MDDEDTSLDPAIAAQMGFSSFGVQASSKKRKYHDGSFIEGQRDRGNVTHAKATGSGANNVELGVRGRKPTANEGQQGISIEQLPGLEAGNTRKEAMGFSGENLPSSTGPAQATQAGRAASKTSLSSKTSNAKQDKGQATGGLSAFLSRGQSLPNAQGHAAPGLALMQEPLKQHPDVQLPDRPLPPVTAEKSNGSGGPMEHSLQAYRQGVRNEKGDMVYFLPSFLEDPWEKLEKGNT